MRKLLVGGVMSCICLSSFGGQGNAAGINIGGRVGDTNITINGVPQQEHNRVRDALIRMTVEAEQREAKLAKMDKLSARQEREKADLKAQLALIEEENRNLQAKLKSDLKEALKPSPVAITTPKTDSIAVAIPATERESFALMERSEDDRADLSLALSKAPDRLDPILKSLIAKTESIDDKERRYWYYLLPRITLAQRMHLFDTLSTERRKLADLERKYQVEIANLNSKHLGEWVEFQRKHVDENDPAAIRAFAGNLIDSAQAKYLTEAESLLLKLIQSRADDAESHYQLGRLYAGREQWQDAQDAVAAAMRIAPDQASYPGLLGKILLREEKPDKALDAYARALRLGTRDTSVLRSYAMLLLKLERYAEAEVVLRKYVEVEPKDAEASRLLGFALSNQDRFAEAEGFLKQAVERDGKNPGNHMSLAWAYYRHHQYAEAESAFRFASDLNPEDIDAITMVGLSSAEQGRRKDALRTFQGAVQQAIRLKVSKADEAEVRLGTALLLAEDGKAGEGKALMADAAPNSQGCSTGYMKTRRNWHDKMLRLLGKWRSSLCGG